MHLNALPFLEPPVFSNLTIESLQFNGNIINADIGLRHPFIGLDQFTGFDVCGLLITNGSVTGFTDPDLRMAGPGDTRLLNPDGYTRWWDPAEFPINNGTAFSYTDGLLGTTDADANFNSTLNAYKYYCDDLADPGSPLTDITLANRGMFGAGHKNVRHYSIEIGSGGLVFNYAVDANWVFPQGGPPYTAPDDFPPNANRPEAYRISTTEVTNTLWADVTGSGGNLTLDIDVYDWAGAELNTVTVESPGNFPIATAVTPVNGGAGYSTYEIEIVDATPITAGNIDLLLTIASNVSGYGGLLPGKAVSAYFMTSVTVDDQAPTQGNQADWPQLQGAKEHIGYAADEHVLHPPLQVAWSADLDTAGGTSTQEGTPIVGDGKILVLYPFNSNNWAECRSLVDGSFLWKTNISPNDYTSYISTQTACYADGKFFVPGDAIRALDAIDGSILWTFTPNVYETQRHGLTYGDGKLYAHIGGTLYIIDPADGSVINSFSVASGYANFQPLTVAGNVAYLQLYGSVRAYDLTTGAMLWNFDVDPPLSGVDASVRGSITVPGDGNVYFGCYNFYFYALNQTTGALVWKHQMNNGTQRSFDTAAYHNGKIYYGEGGGLGTTQTNLACLDASTGDEIWGYHLPESDIADWQYTWYYSSPAVANGVVYASCYKGSFVGLDVDTGEELWRYDPGGNCLSDPAIVDGKVLFIDNNSKLWCFENAG